MPGAQWNVDRWNVGRWAVRIWAPGAVWKDNWRWWYQIGATAQAEWDLTAKVVEARWTTDGYTLGDGTFRGDLQPGHLELRVYDPAQTLLGLGKLGQIWATFKPTGATWCWFIAEVTGHLGAPGDPALNEYVVSADTFAVWMTASAYMGTRPAETVTARLNAVVSSHMNSDYYMPLTSGVIATDNHTVTPLNPDTSHTAATMYVGFLQQLRDAGANGCVWIEAVPSSGPGYAGQMVVHYDLWETVTTRTLNNDQVIAASMWTQATDTLVTEVQWHGTSAAGVATDYQQVGNWTAYGAIKRGPMRVWGDVTSGGGQRAATDATGTAILNDRGDETKRRVDQVQMVSGDRQHTVWDPTTMVWLPNAVMSWNRVSGQPAETYRVVQSAHILNARGWTVTHTLEPYTAPTHLP